MGALWFRLQAEARARWRAWAGLGLLVGVFAGAVVATAAGARRADTAYSRFVKASRTADMLVYNVPGGSLGNVDFDTVERLPQVAESGRSPIFATVQPDLQLGALVDGYGTRYNRFKLLSGRLPDPDRPDEAVVGFTLSESRHLRVGSTLTADLIAAPAAPPAGPMPVVLRVVGIEAGPGEFPPLIGTGTQPVWTGAAFARAHGDDAEIEQVLALRLRHGPADVRAVSDRLQTMGGGKPVATAVLGDQAATVQRSLHLQVVALGILALLAALTVGLVAGQLAWRQTALESGDHPALAAVGMTPIQLGSLAIARAAFVAAGGALVAVTVAIALSPLFPIGLARVAEPEPGVAVDATAITMGALGLVAAVMALVAVPSWRLARASAGVAENRASTSRRRPSPVADAMARAGCPPAATAGVRMGLEPGRGRTAVPVRTTVIGAVVAMTALAASLTFSASLSHLLSTPALYGTNFDAAVGRTGGDDITVVPAVAVLMADPELSAVAVGYAGTPLRVGGVDAGAVALDVKKGSLPPVIVEGRAPRSPDEVALGTRTLRDLGAHIGQTVPAVIPVSAAPSSPVRIVGRAVLPQEGESTGLGRGTVTTVEGLQRLGGGSDFPDPLNAVVPFAPGIDKERARGRLQDRLTQTLGVGWTVSAPDRPTDVVNFGHVQGLPAVMAAVLAVLAAATIGHLLVSSVRRRRHDLAVLKCLGFVRHQVVAVVSWQATTLVIIALVVGFPLGTAVGRWSWSLLAGQLGILARPATPLVALLALVPGALVLANAIAAVPAWSAGRTSPAVVLRSE